MVMAVAMVLAVIAFRAIAAIAIPVNNCLSAAFLRPVSKVDGTGLLFMIQ